MATVIRGVQTTKGDDPKGWTIHLDSPEGYTTLEEVPDSGGDLPEAMAALVTSAAADAHARRTKAGDHTP